MIPAEAWFDEASERVPVAEVPLARLSVELGRLSLTGADLSAIEPWLTAAARAEGVRPGRPRISTCYLVDDYSAEAGPPAEVIPELLLAADRAGLSIDYLARESACAGTDELSPARIVTGLLVADPPPGANGTRPPTADTGWLANGLPPDSPAPAQAMGGTPSWRPPRPNTPGPPVYQDVELWRDGAGGREYSPAFLASVWQLLRLGLVRDHGRAVHPPEPLPEVLPARWEQLPAVIRLGAGAQPFAAYRTLSVLPAQALPVEGAVRMVLEQVMPEEEVAEKVRARARAEGYELGPYTVDRTRHVFY